MQSAAGKSKSADLRVRQTCCRHGFARGLPPALAKTQPQQPKRRGELLPSCLSPPLEFSVQVGVRLLCSPPLLALPSADLLLLLRRGCRLRRPRRPQINNSRRSAARKSHQMLLLVLVEVHTLAHPLAPIAPRRLSSKTTETHFVREDERQRYGASSHPFVHAHRLEPRVSSSASASDTASTRHLAPDTLLLLSIFSYRCVSCRRLRVSRRIRRTRS